MRKIECHVIRDIDRELGVEKEGFGWSGRGDGRGRGEGEGSLWKGRTGGGQIFGVRGVTASGMQSVLREKSCSHSRGRAARGGGAVLEPGRVADQERDVAAA